MPTHPGSDGAARLLTSLVDRSGPPHRSVGGLIDSWHTASGTSLPFGEWADPAAGELVAAFDGGSPITDVELAVVAFAQARAGAGHPAEAVAADLAALVRLAWPSGRGTWGELADPLGLVARALAAWAAERAAASGAGCTDPVTGLVGAGYVRARLRELHDQCRALAISPPVTFAAVVVQLLEGPMPATEQMRLRSVAGRRLADRFRAGETVAALGPRRLAVLMPAHGLDRAVETVRRDLADLAEELSVDGVPFGPDAVSTFRSLAGDPGGS